MKRFILLAALLILAGCESDPNAPDPDVKVVKGVLTGVTMCQEDSSYTTLLLEFEDGLVIKCRARFDNLLEFRRGRTNIVHIDTWQGNLEKVEFLEPAENLANQ